MADSKEANHSAKSDYSGFIFSFLNSHNFKYYIIKVIIFVCLIFIIPKIIIFEFGLGISWLNIFYISPEYISTYPDFWSGMSPTLDYLNILGLLGITLFIILSKGLYENLISLKNTVIKNLQLEDESHLEKIRKEKDIYYWNRIKTFTKRVPLLLMIIVAIGVPICDFLLFNLTNYIGTTDPNPALFYIQNYFGLAILYAFFICIAVITLSSAILIFKLGNENIHTNLMHADGVGGLKIFGEAAVKNILSWMTLVIIIVMSGAILILTNPDPARVVSNSIIIVGTLILTIVIFYGSIMGGHNRLIDEKREAVNELDDELLDLLKLIKKKDIGEPGINTEELLLRLDFLCRSTYYTHIINMKEWPIDNNILTKTIVAILFPVAIAILGVIIEVVYFSG